MLIVWGSFKFSQYIYFLQRVVYIIEPKKFVACIFFDSESSLKYEIKTKHTWCISDCSYKQVSRSSNTGTKKGMRNQSFHDLQITLLDLILTSNIQLNNAPS